MPDQNSMKTCFVIMGFGEKTDYQSNPHRILDLDRTFEDIIQPAVTAAGLECIRADRIIHSAVIDKPMYEHLLDADLVIADLSTSNANAIYELGVRHALRPHSTIVIAEAGFAFPFDLNHLSIAKYSHMGTEIGYREVLRMRELLQQKVAAILAKQETDSPVFMFLPQLLGNEGRAVPPPAPTAAPKDEESFAALLESFNKAKRAIKTPDDWLVVAALVKRLQTLQPNDPYLIQQLALATYKSRHPDIRTSLLDARAVLGTLRPDTSSDAEVVGLWGAIHKRLWEVGHCQDRVHLDMSIRSYSRAYAIKGDYYNGASFAALLLVRGAVQQGDEATADVIMARRTYGEVLELCDAALSTGRSVTAEWLSSRTSNPEDMLWIEVTRVEALLVLGRQAEAESVLQRIIHDEPQPEAWVVNDVMAHITRLTGLIRGQLATISRYTPRAR